MGSVVGQVALTRVLRDFAGTIIGRYDVHDILYELADAVVEILPVSGAGVSLADDDGVLHSVAATDDHSTELERFQEELREGPCVDAYRSCAPVVAPDLHSSRQWPRFARVALAQGLHMVAGFPLRIDGHAIGALNAYCSAPFTPAQSDLDAAAVLSDIAASYVIYANALDRSEERARQLQQALNSRVVVEQAKGVLAERHGIRTRESFELLRRHARSHNLSVHDVARAVIEGSLRLAAPAEEPRPRAPAGGERLR